jgi:hypothetical protein
MRIREGGYDEEDLYFVPSDKDEEEEKEKESEETSKNKNNNNILIRGNILIDTTDKNTAEEDQARRSTRKGARHKQ